MAATSKYLNKSFFYTLLFLFLLYSTSTLAISISESISQQMGLQVRENQLQNIDQYQHQLQEVEAYVPANGRVRATGYLSMNYFFIIEFRHLEQHPPWEYTLESSNAKSGRGTSSSSKKDKKDKKKKESGRCFGLTFLHSGPNPGTLN